MKKELLDRIKAIESEQQTLQQKIEHTERDVQTLEDRKGSLSEALDKIKAQIKAQFIKEVKEFSKDGQQSKEKALELIKDYAYVMKECVPMEIRDAHMCDEIYGYGAVVIKYLFGIEETDAIKQFLIDTSWMKVLQQTKEKFKKVFSRKRPLFQQIPHLCQGEFAWVIAALFELYGKLDAKQAAKDVEDIYYSKRTLEDLYSASIGEFGQVFDFLYAEHGFDQFWYVQRELMLCHEDGYKKYAHQQEKPTRLKRRK